MYNHIWLPELWVNQCQVETLGFTRCLKVFNIWLHLLEGVTVYLDVQSRLLTLPWVYGAARWADIWGIVFQHAVPDRCRLQRLSGLNALICHYRPACGGLLFQAKLVWHWAAGTLLLPVSCLSSNKMWKMRVSPSPEKDFAISLKSLGPFLCVPIPYLPGIERQGQWWAPEEPQQALVC